LDKVTPIDGIRYLVPPDDMLLEARDGNVSVPCGDVPIPLLVEDYEALDGAYPSYDAVGRGIYQALRANPDCMHGERYVSVLRDAYPHYLSEIATNILMLEHKDVEAPYLDRKVNLLKIFARMEPDNPRFPFEIGLTLMDKGLRLSILHMVTVTLYKAAESLGKALEMAPESTEILVRNGEISYLLGRYDQAAGCWKQAIRLSGDKPPAGLAERLKFLMDGDRPFVPPVDYLQALGSAIELVQQEEFAEAVAIIHDVMEDVVFSRDFLTAEFYMMLASCYEKMSMPKYAEDYYKEALRLEPDSVEATEALAGLSGAR